MFAAGAAAAQQYPAQRVTIIVPFSAGSNTDGQARIIADKLSELWKQQVIVENRPGVAGTASVAKSPADGYTLMLTSSGHPVANVITRSAPFRARGSRIPKPPAPHLIRVGREPAPP